MPVRTSTVREKLVFSWSSGKDVQKLGVPEGPQIRKILGLLLDTKINGEIIDRENEEKIARKWGKGRGRGISNAR